VESSRRYAIWLIEVSHADDYVADNGHDKNPYVCMCLLTFACTTFVFACVCVYLLVFTYVWPETRKKTIYKLYGMLLGISYIISVCYTMLLSEEL